MGSNSGGSQLEEYTTVIVHEPKKFNVLMHNDDVTTMDFVVEVLMTIYRKSNEKAVDIMLEIHTKGKSICGIYTQEIAETKIAQTHLLARKAGFPLRCSMEEE